MSMKQLAINSAIVFGTLTGVFLLWEFHKAALLFLLSLVIAATLRPLGEVFTRRRFSDAAAVMLVYGLTLIGLGVLFWWAGSSLVVELQRLGDDLTRTYDLIWTTWPKGNLFQQWLIHQLPAPANLWSGLTANPNGSALSGLFGLTMGATSFLGEFFTVFVLSIYWSIDRVHFERLWLSLLPVESRARARDIWRAIERDFGLYVRSELLQSILAGILLGAGLWIIGVPYPTLLATFAAFAWLIPWFGGLLVLLPVALFGFAQSIFVGAAATALALGVMFLLNFFIEPRFIRPRQVSSLLSILLMIAFIEPFGLIGFIIAPPLAAAIELVLRYNLQSRPTSSTQKSEEQLEVLRERILQLRENLANNESTPEPQILSLLGRLEDLTNRTDQILETEKPRQRRVSDQLSV